MYVPHNEPGIGDIARKCFPHNKRDITVALFTGPRSVNSYWDGGSRDYYFLYDLVTKETYAVPETHPFYSRTDSGQRAGEVVINELPPNCCLVQGGIFMGKDASVRVYLREENMVKLLPKQQELSDQEKMALNTIGGYQSGYRRDEFKRLRLGEYGVSNPHVVSLAGKGLLKLTKVGVSITTEGRNAR